MIATSDQITEIDEMIASLDEAAIDKTLQIRVISSEGVPARDLAETLTGFYSKLSGVTIKLVDELPGINDDDKKNVNENRLIAIKNLNLNKKKLILITQTHSSKVIRITKNNLDKNIEADGVITSLNNVVLGILTADCAPVIIYDDKNKFICNLHSGWKGSLNNISQKAIKLFDKYQIKRKNLTAIVGPCLGVKNYEVDKNFQKKFIERNIKYTKKS